MLRAFALVWRMRARSSTVRRDFRSNLHDVPRRASTARGQRRLHTLRREWDLAKTRAGGVENRVADCGRDDGDGSLTRAGGLFIGHVEQHGFDLGHLEA